MATGRFRRFEDILAWQQARTLVNEIYNITDALETFRKDPGLTGKLRSTAISIMTNIAKGFGSQSPTIFADNLREALSSAAEIQSLLYICADLERIDRRRFEHLANMTQICVRMIQELHALINKKIENIRRTTQHNAYGRPQAQPQVRTAPTQPVHPPPNSIPPAQPLEQPTRPSRPVRPETRREKPEKGSDEPEIPEIIPTHEFNRLFVDDEIDE